MKTSLTLAMIVAVVMGTLVASARPAQAEIGVGLFLGQPTGLDVKIDLQRRSALDLVIGWDDFDDDRGRDGYAHLTYLVGLGVARGRSVLVPFRLGIGGVVYGGAGDFGDEVNVGVRAPFEVGLRFRRTPLEIYGEVAIKLTLLDDNDNDDDVDADGGIGLRVYF
jgi:hypothetical protein